MLDAYTLRKAIPRLVVAVIAINLSIYLCVAALDITTIIGKGLNQLLVTPFVQNDSFGGIDIKGNTTNTIAGVLGVGGVLVGILTLIFVDGLFVSAALGLLGILMP